MMKNLAAPVFAVMVAMSASPAFALEDEILAYPSPGTVERYVANEAVITALRATILDTSLAPAARLEALRTLNIDYPVAAEITARSLTTDAEESVALASIQLLSAGMTMMNHEHSGEMAPSMAYLMQQYEANLVAMRKAELDERKSVRTKAAELLASLSDAPTFASIAIGVQSGRYTEAEATNLYTLGSTELASAYLAPYLGSGKIDAENNAIGYLGALPDYQPRIRDTYFLNTTADLTLRAGAAEALGTYDATFGSYALKQLPELQATPELYSAALSSYLNNQQIFGAPIDPNVARELSVSIDDVLRNPDAAIVVQDLNRLQQDLNGIFLNAPGS